MIISLCIYAFKIIPSLQKKFSKNEAKEAGKEKKVVVSAVQDMRSVMPPQEQDNSELIAVISAAIAAATGTSTDDFVVRSIKRRF